jgi:GGDEF domain-containing protein
LPSAATSVLRGQDRLGRWGGEEWLLVLPGTAVDELQAVFERLRTRFAAASVARPWPDHTAARFRWVRRSWAIASPTWTS